MNRRQWCRLALAGYPLGPGWVAGCGGQKQQDAPGLAMAPAQASEGPTTEKLPGAHGQIEVLLFDVFGTVVDWRASLISQFEQFGNQHGLNADWQALAVQWQASYLPSLDEVRKNHRPFVGLEALRRETLDRLLPAFGLGKVVDEDRAELVRCWSRLQPWPDTVAALTRLKRKFIIIAFSNGGFGMLVDLARHGRLPWDAVLSSDLFRHFKPDAEVYRGAVDLLARPPASIMLVAAHNIDLAAARANGLKTAYVQRPTEDPKPTSDWNIVARDFADLADQLGA
jgi:2-haloacid dehalogenase